jgi:small-conductance mechanosensitive channel
MRPALPMKRLAAILCIAGMMAGGALAQTAAPAAKPPAAAAQPSSPPPAPADAAPAADAPPSVKVEEKAAGIPVEELVRPVGALNTAIEAAENNLAQRPGSQTELSALRAEIEKIESDAKKATDTLTPRLEDVRSQISKLGAPPAPHDPPEAPDVAEERKRLNSIAAQIDGAIKKAALIEVRARQLVSRVRHARQGIFTRFLFRQTDTPLQWKVWTQAADQVPLASRQVSFIVSNWWSVARLSLNGVLGVLGGAAAAFLALFLFRRRLVRSQLDDAGPSMPSLAQRAAAAAWVAPLLALPGFVAVILLYVGFDELGLLYWQVARFAEAAVFPLLVMIGVMALARALLQPNRPRWRLFDLDDKSARMVCVAVQGIAVVYALDYVLQRLVSILSLPLSSSIVTAFIASLLYAAFLLLIARTPLTPQATTSGVPVSRWSPYWLKTLLVVLAVTLVATSLLGYVALGRFIVTQLLTTGSGLLVLVVLYIAIHAVVPEPSERPTGMTAIIEQSFSLDQFGRQQLVRVQHVLLTMLLFAAAIPLLLLSLGLSVPDIVGWIRAAVFGFDIGGIRLSPARILIAVVLFILLLATTRFVQRWLAAGALAQGRMEAGLANSIYTGAGYIGFAVATLAAISYAGFDITNLAIVAGALSVGIGFGLQSIVNNFVSGLILLIERPIKVGDRVTVDGQEGFVRRISVRSTEIETFDRSSLIVPNSEFITKTVTNWTHRNALGRALVKVVVSNDSEPERVIEILLKVASESPLVQKHPQAWAGFENFGPDGLEFLLIAVVGDVNKVGDARSDLRVRILKAFRAAGIEFPTAQRDIHIRDSDGLKVLVRSGDSPAGSRPPARG